MDNGREIDSPTNLFISIGQPSGPGDVKSTNYWKHCQVLNQCESIADVEVVIWVVVSLTVNTLKK